MKKSTKLVMTAAASLLGVALAAGGAYATGGSITVPDEPGQTLEVAGVGPAYAHASDNAKAHANPNAKGIFGTSGEGVVKDKAPKVHEEADVETETDVKSDSAADVTVPREAAKNASTVKGSETGETVKAWAHAKKDVEVVTPEAAVDVKVDADVKADVRENGDR